MDQAYHLLEEDHKADRSAPRAVLKHPILSLLCQITLFLLFVYIVVLHGFKKNRVKKKLSLAALWQLNLLLHILTPEVPDQGDETLCFVFNIL